MDGLMDGWTEFPPIYRNLSPVRAAALLPFEAGQGTDAFWRFIVGSNLVPIGAHMILTGPTLISDWPTLG